MTLIPPHFSRLRDDVPRLTEELDRFVDQLNAEVRRVDDEAEDQLQVDKTLFVGTELKVNQARFGRLHAAGLASSLSAPNCSVWLPAASTKDLGKRTAVARMHSGGIFKVLPSAGQYINGVATGLSPSMMGIYTFRWMGDGATRGWRVEY